MKLKKQKASGDHLLATGICILAMSVLCFLFLGYVETIQTKMSVSQLARRYLLRMETVGYLIPADKEQLLHELERLEVEEIQWRDTTQYPVGHGETITLCISGRLKGGYTFEERKVSTAKN